MPANQPACPTCGYGNVPTISRIRCRYCARRIPAAATVCPNCQHNPRAFYWKRWHGVAAVILVLCALGILGSTLGADFIGSTLNEFEPFRAIALGATPTARATLPPITVIITATPRPTTRVPVSPTQALVASSTPAPTETPRFTATPTPTLTQISGPPQPTATFTPVPTQVPIPPPKLVAPTDNERIQGANKRIALTFQPAQPIGAQEWYRVQVDYLDRVGQSVSWCAFTKANALDFPRELFEETSPNVRSFLWRVNVVRAEQFAPSTCDAPYQLLSAPGEAWTFYWY
ncbi:MAG: hypothetical protein HDKAJFGB_01791 [Anaerolineae bacterium]|nr:hypothetical protein [Anaerolineae bacterium]